MSRPVLGFALLALSPAAVMAGPAGSVDTQRWSRAPTDKEIAEAYPAKARAASSTGDSSMTCTANDVGELERCVVDRDDPPGMGFGAAERSLAEDFRMIPSVVAGHPVAVGVVSIPMHWAIAPAGEHLPQVWDRASVEPAAAQSSVVGIKWRRLPGSDDLFQTYPANAYAARLPGWATVACRANAKGQLKACALVEENPAGDGFGEAAQKFAPTYFLLQPTADDGSSVEGVKVAVKISWDMKGIEYFYSQQGER